jgi:hypothetical protein
LVARTVHKASEALRPPGFPLVVSDRPSEAARTAFELLKD